jgi:hypothetical protein
VRAHAYLLSSEIYRELEPQILEQLREASRDQLLYLLAEAEMMIELLSGEWRVLFSALSEYFQHVDVERGRARMAVSADELGEFVAFLRDPERRRAWAPIAFGLAELADALPVGMDLVGLVIVEESDDWMWVEHPYEIQMMRPEVHALLYPYMENLLDRGQHAVLTRLCSDHAEAAIEFRPEAWANLLAQAAERVPELVAVIEGTLTQPRDYQAIREALTVLSDPALQPSLDAWLRVHADMNDAYALYFRDEAKERG